jgi:hypothetical protein
LMMQFQASAAGPGKRETPQGESREPERATGATNCGELPVRDRIERRTVVIRSYSHLMDRKVCKEAEGSG